MHSLSDQQLLREYVEHQSESAFAELVRRHIDLVYSAAVRMVCNAHLAQEVTQEVFVALAKSGPRLVDRPVLSGWLHRTAQNIAAETVRTEVRRRAREQESVAMDQLSPTESDTGWENIAPHLDDALGNLSESERDAVLLRYFEGKSACEMGQILGVGDAAAQKRVSRGVEHLRAFLARRGVTVGASGLAVLISAHAVQSAPVGLTLSVSAAALAGGALASTAVGASAGSGGTAFTLAKAIIMTKVKVSILSAIVVASVAAPLVIQHQAQVRLHQENESLRSQLGQLHQLGEETERLSNQLAQAGDSISLAGKQMSELLRLRGEVGKLRQENSEVTKLRQENQGLRAAAKSQAQRSRKDSSDGAAAGDMDFGELKDLGVVELSEQTPTRLDLGTGKEWLATAAMLTNGGLELRFASQSETNADGLATQKEQTMVVSPGRRIGFVVDGVPISLTPMLKPK